MLLDSLFSWMTSSPIHFYWKFVLRLASLCMSVLINICFWWIRLLTRRQNEGMFWNITITHAPCDGTSHSVQVNWTRTLLQSDITLCCSTEHYWPPGVVSLTVRASACSIAFWFIYVGRALLEVTAEVYLTCV